MRKAGLMLACGLTLTLAVCASSAGAAVLYDQTDNAAPPTLDEEANFSPSNLFGVGNGDRTADDFTVPPGTTWRISSIRTAGIYSAAAAQSANVYLYANGPAQPGAEIFSQLNIAAPGPDYAVPLTGAPVLKPGTYWVTVQHNVGGGGYWSWGTRTVQSGNPAHWISSGTVMRSGRADATISGGMGDCGESWGVRTGCWTGTSPDQTFALDGELTPLAKKCKKPKKKAKKGAAAAKKKKCKKRKKKGKK